MNETIFADLLANKVRHPEHRALERDPLGFADFLELSAFENLSKRPVRAVSSPVNLLVDAFSRFQANAFGFICHVGSSTCVFGFSRSPSRNSTNCPILQMVTHGAVTNKLVRFLDHHSKDVRAGHILREWAAPLPSFAQRFVSGNSSQPQPERPTLLW